MNTTKLFSLLLLTVLFCSAIPFSVAPVLSNTSSSIPLSATGSNVLTPSPEPAHRIIPLSMLVYTQYADVDWKATGEYNNTMGAIIENYGTDFYQTNLTDYTNLATALPGNDILLIPEQEVASHAELVTVGQAWGTTLADFVTAGGIVILMDYHGGSGDTYQIYNQSSLITIDGDYDITSATVYRVNSSDALARGIASSYTAPNGALSFDTSDGTTVVDDGVYPVVVHKVMGKGHLVLIGADFYAREANTDEILVNAIRLHRHVVFDDSHGQYDNIFGGFSSYADDLVAEGFAVSSMGSFSASFFEACDVLVIPAASYSVGTAYSVGEIASIRAFVEGGGGLFLIQDWKFWDPHIEPIANEFGYVRSNYGWLNDSDDCPLEWGSVVYSGANILNHSLTLGVSQFENYWGGGFSSLPADAHSIIITDTDGTTTWNDSTTSIYGVTIFAVSTFQSGRVAVTLDFNWLLDDSDLDGDATFDYDESDNQIIALNTIRWLSAAGLKERIVLFDESHTPYEILSGQYLDFGNYLTSNGYTLHWMSTFHATLLDEAHVLFICEGIVSYSVGEINAITEFVVNGGGLFLALDWGDYGDELDPIGNQFGLDRSDNIDYLNDTDDYIVYGSYVKYDGVNIGTHPIMQGISRIELDRSTAFDSIGVGTALVSTDTDGTSVWNSGNTIANGLAVIAATEYELGRVVCITDVNFFELGTDPDGDGEDNFYDSDNNLFTVNAFQWLAENRAPSVIVTYPNGAETLTGTASITWTAVDPNKDAITSYDVYYSDNNGGTWHSIALGLATLTTDWDTTGVDDGDQYLIRVVAHDYELAGEDQSDAVFSVDNVTPTPTPPIPGFPFEAVALGLLFSLGLVFVIRRHGRREVHH